MTTQLKEYITDNQVLCSTGCFIGRVNQRDHTLILKLQDKIDCDAFEFMMYDTWYDKIKNILSDLKGNIKPAPVFHADKTIGELLSKGNTKDNEIAVEYFKTNLEIASELGCKIMVLHLWGGIASDKKIENNIKTFPILYELAKQAHILLTVENVVCNQRDPLFHLKQIKSEYPYAAFTFDTKMAQFHNQMDCIYEKEQEWLWEENCIRHIHMNDYAGGYLDWEHLKTMQIGEGHVNLSRFAEFLLKKSYHGYVTVEATSMKPGNVIELDALNRSLDHVKKMLCITKTET